MRTWLVLPQSHRPKKTGMFLERVRQGMTHNVKFSGSYDLALECLMCHGINGF